MASPVFGSATSNSGGATTTAVVNFGSNNVNDLLIAVIATSGAAATGITTPSGWEQLVNLDGGGAGPCGAYIAYKLSSGSETSQNFTIQNSQGYGSQGLVYTGLDTTEPIDTSSALKQQTFISTATCLAAFANTANTTLLRFVFKDDDISWATGSSEGTERYNIAYAAATVGDNGIAIGLSDIAQASAGDTGSSTWVGADTEDQGTITIVLASESVVTTNPTVRSMGFYETGTSNRTAWDMIMPGEVHAADLLVAMFGVDNGGGSATISSIATTIGTWTRLGTANSIAGIFGDVFVLKAPDGDEGSVSVTATISVAERGVARIFCIRNWFGDIADGVGTEHVNGSAGTETTPDPASITTTWDSADNLFIAIAAHDADVLATVFPYADHNYTDTSGAASNGAGLSVCTDIISGQTSDPGPFTISASQETVAITVVLRPAAAGGLLSGVLPVEFDVIADLKAGGLLSGALPIEYNVLADLKADGQLVGILPIEFNVVADLKAGGLLSGVLPIEFNVLASLIAQLGTTLLIEFNTVSSLTGQGKLDAVLPIEFDVVANLLATGLLSAVLPIEYNVVADLKADGQLVATPLAEFDVAANLIDATAGAISGILPMEFNVIAGLSNASIPILPFIDRRHIAAFVN